MNGSVIQTGLLLLAVAFTASPARCSDIVEKDTIKKTLKFTAAPEGRRILVDNVNGEIRLTGYDGRDVELIAYKTIRAESERRMERAKEEVSLDIREDGDRIVVYVDGPWRRNDGSVNYRGRDHEGYEVFFDFELRVPSKTDFTLRTVNNGDIIVRNIQGEFEVRNVNGGVEMREVDGAGSVSTVNGNLEVRFARNPDAPVSFKTVNGGIEAVFPSTPSADMRFKTMNGEVYTDFDVKGIPTPFTVKEKRGGKKVYGSGGSFMVASGGGGPELSFNTLNGNIYLSLKGESK